MNVHEFSDKCMPVGSDKRGNEVKTFSNWRMHDGVITIFSESIRFSFTNNKLFYFRRLCESDAWGAHINFHWSKIIRSFRNESKWCRTFGGKFRVSHKIVKVPKCESVDWKFWSSGIANSWYCKKMSKLKSRYTGLILTSWGCSLFAGDSGNCFSIHD